MVAAKWLVAGVVRTAGRGTVVLLVSILLYIYEGAVERGGLCYRAYFPHTPHGGVAPSTGIGFTGRFLHHHPFFPPRPAGRLLRQQEERRSSIRRLPIIS